MKILKQNLQSHLKEALDEIEILKDNKSSLLKSLEDKVAENAALIRLCLN